MKTNSNQKVIFVMGVSGSGKTSVGQLLAKELAIPFFDADDHHPPSNIEKMSRGIPLNDEDRKPWLNNLHQIAVEHISSGCVITCSALKEIYRKRMNQSIESNVLWVYLKGSYDLIFERMKKRKNHFMNTKMLKSQFETLEEPTDAINIDIADSLEVIVQKVKENIK